MDELLWSRALDSEEDIAKDYDISPEDLKEISQEGGTPKTGSRGKAKEKEDYFDYLAKKREEAGLPRD